MGTARSEHTATLLPNGRVLVAGGYNSNDGYLASAELYDPATGTFSPTWSMGTARSGPSATMLLNGKVLVIGGVFAGGGYNASAELYDPATGTFSPTASLGTARFTHTATLLPNGQVLVAGGCCSPGALASAELYDPASGTFSPTGPMGTARRIHTATLLPNGQVLVAGGADSGGGSLASAELYDPASGTFSPTGSMGGIRYAHVATLLPSGMVLVAGGNDTSTYPGTSLTPAELYDPTTETFSATGPLSMARGGGHTATLLSNGKVLVTGGASTNEGYLASAELYDPATETFEATGSMGTARFVHTATLLPNGRVLVAGGQNNSGHLASAEVYSPVPPTLSSIAVTPADPTIHVGQTQQFTATGTFSDGSTQILPLPSAWSQLSPTGGPPPGRARHAYNAYDQSSNRLIIFGGWDSSVCCSFTNDVWVLTNANGLGGTPQWINLIPPGDPGAPSPRADADSVYDPATNRMIIFGGQNETFDSINETWVLTNANGLTGLPTWIQLSPTGGPPPERFDNKIAYDASNNLLIVFGGMNWTSGTLTPLNDVWILTHANGLGGTPAWSQLFPAGTPPSPRSSFGGFYDHASNRFVVFAGCTDATFNCQTTDSELWVLENANGIGGTPTWSPLTYAGDPPPASGALTGIEGYAPATNEYILFGGWSSGQFTKNETWVLRHANGLSGTPYWTQIFPENPPSPRVAGTRLYDAATNRLIVFGGLGGQPVDFGTMTNDLWVLTNANGSGQVTWSSSNPGVATVDQAGLARGLTTGSTTITVKLTPPAGLVGWWPGDGNGNDLAGGHNGTLAHGAGFEPGVSEQAFSFDGVDDLVRVDDAPNLDLTGPLSIEAWVRLDTLNPGPILWKGSDPGARMTSPYSLVITTAGNLEGWIGDGVAFEAVSSSTTFPLGTFVHVAFTVDGSTLRLYINGELDATAPQTIVPYSSSFNLQIGSVEGGSLGGTPLTLDGAIDELKLYARALSQEEIQSIISTGSISGSTTLTVVSPNQPPVANAGSDQVIEASRSSGASVTLNGSGSSDPNGDSLTYGWVGPFGVASGVSPTVPLPRGTNTVTLTVSDGQSTSADTVVITVQDSTSPTVAILDPGSNALIGSSPVSVIVQASDVVGIDSVSVNGVLASLLTGTPQAGTWQALVPVSLGGTLTFTATATDTAGNSTSATAVVDNDGIDVAVDKNRGTDADESQVFSNDINDGLTSGTIVDRGGWTIRVTDVPLSVAPTGVMGTGRASHTMTLLLNGKGLIAGGRDGSSTATASAELYDPASGAFTPTGSMGTERYNHTATLLPNGQVLLAGGFDGSGIPSASAELYDPATGVLTATGSMGTGRALHAATLLPNGQVLFTGGFSIPGGALASAELYDPATGMFTPAGAMGAARWAHTAALLANGRVLVTGGATSNGIGFSSAELYDSATGVFSPTGSMGTQRFYHTATPLPNGNVLITGGLTSSCNGFLASAELYDPATGMFAATGSMGAGRYVHSATLLASGHVLITGGLDSCASGSLRLRSAELYDPAAGAFTTTESMSTGRAAHVATLLSSGKVLLSGGGAGSDLASAELFVPKAVRLSITGAGTRPARVAACGGTYKEIRLDGAGETGDIRCNRDGTITVTAVSASPLIEIWKQNTTTLTQRCYPIFDNRGQPVGRNCVYAPVVYWEAAFVPAGNTITTGSPFTASPDNTQPVLVEFADEDEAVFGSFQLDPGESVDVNFIANEFVDQDTVQVTVLSGTVTFTIRGLTTTLSTGQSQSAPAVNLPPVADAGSTQTVEATSPTGASVTLNGSASSDPNGDPLTFSWSGPFGTVTGVSPTVIVPLGTHVLTLTVIDPEGLTGTASVTVTVVNPPPVMTGIGEQTVNEAETLTLIASATDANGDTLAYSATGLPAGAAFNPSTQTFSYTPGYDVSTRLADHVFEVVFTVSDGTSAVSQRVQVTVRNVNRPPVASAGVDQQMACAGATCPITLDGTGSTDPDSSPGTQDDIAQYRWYERYGMPDQQLLGTGATLVAILDLGMHTVTLEVTDQSGAIGTDTVTITLDPARLSLFMLEKAEVDWPKAPGALADVKLHGRLALPVGLLLPEVDPMAQVGMDLAGQLGLFSQTVAFEVKGGEGEKWEYKANFPGAGIQRFFIHWKGAKFAYNGAVHLKTESIALDQTTLSLDRGAATDPVSLSVGGVTAVIDAAGAVTASVPYEVDEDGEVTFTLPFELTPDMDIMLTVGTFSQTIPVVDYYTPGSGKFEFNANVNVGALTGASRPATLGMTVALGSEGFPGASVVTESEWKKLSTKEWKAELKR
ncbi:MAG: kelch repeat-containing protein [Nitrospirota bacterium]